MIKTRRDGNAVVFFDTTNGSKVRFAEGEYTKAYAPELVDIKITDYCPFMCAFCYQGSTPEGAHSTWENMKYVIDELASKNVFEIAYGGGEPTDHPDFLRILQYTKEQGIVPNFTTKSMGWVKRNWDAIEPYIGAFAYSAEKISDLNSADIMFSEIPRERINIHYVMGLGDERHFVDFLKRAAELKFRVTLLGYKTTGRGNDVVPYPYDNWVDLVTMLVMLGKCPSLSIDTPLAEQFDGRMPIPSTMYHTREGFVSMYVDTVAMKMGASSFENLDTLVPFDENWVERYALI